MVLLSRHLFVLLILLILPWTSFASSPNDHITISSQVSLPGSWICQDGQQVYFKSKSICLKANINLVTQEQFDCDSDLSLRPINEVEEFFVPERPGLSMARFYSIPLEYLSNTGAKRTVGYCSNKSIKNKANFYSAREASHIQSYLIYTLLKNDILIINGPSGVLDFSKYQTQFKSVPLQNNSSNSNSLFSINGANSLELGTPFCNPGLSKNSIYALMGGDRTGGGLKSMNSKTLQDLSTKLEVNWQDPREIGEALNKEFDPKINPFSAKCL